ncbi:MAG: ABC transporter permease [Cystobacterineae bacterium]|nr:ABC transporter permease [Cystobacterineae bacterium]
MIQVFFDNFKLVWNSFVSNPLRTLITLLGIVIGTITIIVTMGLFEGLSGKVEKDFSMMGADVFSVSKWPMGISFSYDPKMWDKILKAPNLSMEDRRAILSHCPSVEFVAAYADARGIRLKTTHSQTSASVRLTGATADYIDTGGFQIALGRFFSEVEELEGARVVVLAADVVDSLFPLINPIGQKVRIRERPYTVIGTLARRGKWMGMVNLDNGAMVPMPAFLSSYGLRQPIILHVKAKSSESFERAQDEVKRLMWQRRNIKTEDEENFFIGTYESMTRQLKELSFVVAISTFAVSALSLLVGGIGILNIMLVAVTERTREIGLRRALGARKGRILFQFASEATVLSLLGALLGFGIGLGVSGLIGWVGAFPSQVPLWAIGLALGTSIVVGITFGFYPALRASRLNPIEAMRAE